MNVVRNLELHEELYLYQIGVPGSGSMHVTTMYSVIAIHFFFIAGTFLSAGVSWTNVNSQAIQKKPWIEKTQTFIRGGRQAEQRNSSQVNVNLSIFFLVI